MTTTQAELQAKWMAKGLGLVRVAYPARVESYEAVGPALMVTVKLACPVLFRDADDVISAIPIPPILCPVAFPGPVTWEISQGDEGLVVFADRETSAWRRSGAIDAPPVEGRFRLEDGHFFPTTTGRPASPELLAAAAVPGTVIRGETYLGGPAAQLLSSDPLVQAELARLWAALHAVNAAIPTGLVAAVDPAAIPGPTATTKTRGE